MANLSSDLSGRVAGEIRAEMARQQRRGTWMAKQMGMTQSAWSRRATGDLPLDLNELERVAAVLDVPLNRLLGWSADGWEQRTCSDGLVGHDLHVPIAA